MRRAVKAALGLGALAAAFLGMRAAHVAVALGQVSALPRSTIFLVAGTSLAQPFALATRLWSVFPTEARPGWARVARGFSFGQLANSCLPGRAGDVLKVVTIAGGSETRRTTAADATGVVLADKALDVVTLAGLVLLLAPALLIGAVAGAMRAAWLAGAALGLLAGAAILLRRVRPTAFAGLREAAAAAARSFRGLLTPGRLAAGLALGCAAWMAEATSVMILSAPLGVQLSLAQAMVALFVLNLGIAVPVSVANVGAYEASLVLGLTRFGVALPQAIAIGVVHHAAQIATVALAAFAFWLRDRLAESPRARLAHVQDP